MGIFKVLKKVAGFAAPIVGNIIAPGIGGVLGGALGGALSGGGLKGIAAGALGGAALPGGYSSAFGSALTGGALSSGLSGALGGALLGGGSGALLGGGKGALLGGALGGASGYVQGSGGLSNAASNIKSSLGFGADTSSVPGATSALGGGTSSYAAKDVGKAINWDQLAPDKNGIGWNTPQTVANIAPSAAASSSGSFATPLLSAGIGAVTNSKAEDQLLAGQDKAAALLAQYQNQKFDASDLSNDSGYQFQLAEGNKAIDRAAAARGGYYSGQALTDAADYSKGLTDTTVNNAYGRFAGDLSRNIGVASGLGDIYTNEGNTRANATTNLGNIFTGSLAAATGGKGINATGQTIDPSGISNDYLMQLLRQRGLA